MDDLRQTLDPHPPGIDPDEERTIPALALRLFGASVEMSFNASDRVIENERAEAKRQSARADQAQEDLFYVVAVQRMLADPVYARRLYHMLRTATLFDPLDPEEEERT